MEAPGSKSSNVSAQHGETIGSSEVKGAMAGRGLREGSRNTADIKREMGKMGKGAVTGEREWRSIQKEGGGTNNTKIV